jgi:hypothetical protein
MRLIDTFLVHGIASSDGYSHLHSLIRTVQRKSTVVFRLLLVQQSKCSVLLILHFLSLPLSAHEISNFRYDSPVDIRGRWKAGYSSMEEGVTSPATRNRTQLIATLCGKLLLWPPSKAFLSLRVLIFLAPRVH